MVTMKTLHHSQHISTHDTSFQMFAMEDFRENMDMLLNIFDFHCTLLQDMCYGHVYLYINLKLTFITKIYRTPISFYLFFPIFLFLTLISH